MNPTNELRYVIRETGATKQDIHGYFYKETVTVLQQKWVKQVFNEHGVAHDTDQAEWRDVPTVVEAA